MGQQNMPDAIARPGPSRSKSPEKGKLKKSTYYELVNNFKILFLLFFVLNSSLLLISRTFTLMCVINFIIIINIIIPVAKYILRSGPANRLFVSRPLESENQANYYRMGLMVMCGQYVSVYRQCWVSRPLIISTTRFSYPGM